MDASNLCRRVYQFVLRNPELKKSEFETLALKHEFKRSRIRSFIDNGVQAGLIRSITSMNNAQRIVLSPRV
jgi:hypothetical protein